MTSNVVMTGYKVFNSDWKCKKFQFVVGETFTIPRPSDLHLCSTGFHFCLQPVECNEHYQLSHDNKYALVETAGNVIIGEDKCVTSSIKIVREISYAEWLKLCTCEYIIYYDSEKQKKKKECNYVNGILDGSYKEWHLSGLPKCEKNYCDGGLNGDSKEWFGCGQLSRESQYRNWKLHGKSRDWSSKGFLNYEREYADGELHGKQVEYHAETNQIYYEGFNKKGKKDGVCRNFDTDGKKRAIYVYNNGVKQSETRWDEHGDKIKEILYHDSRSVTTGKIKCVWDKFDNCWYQHVTPKHEINYKNSQKHGKETTYYTSGVVEFVTEWQNGEQIGLHQGWDENGKSTYQSHYEKGKLNGLYISWDKEGNKELECFYVNDKKHGIEIKYILGNKVEETVYFGDYPASKWKYNDKIEPIEETCYYTGSNKKKFVKGLKDGKLHGLCSSWDKNGNLIFEYIFDNGKNTQMKEVLGYKAFNSDWTCRSFEFKVGETYFVNNPIVVLVSGFHFCLQPVDCNRYYSLDGGRKYAIVKSLGKVVTESDKCVTQIIEIVKEISREEWLKLCTCTYVEYFDPEKQKRKNKVGYIEGILDGLCEGWDRSGNKISEVFYKNGVKNGKMRTWTDQGFLHKEIDYKNNLNDGKEIVFHLNTTIKKLEASWEDGSKHGRYSYWSENGQKTSEGVYKTGKLDGLVTKWEYNGDKTIEELYAEGDLIRQSKYENNSLVEETEFYPKRCQKKYEIYWKNGKKVKIENQWFETGQRLYECSYNMNGEKDGKEVCWYNKEGQKKYEKTFVNGLECGTSIHWYENKQKEYELVYVKGILQKYEFWDENGLPVICSIYEEGYLHYQCIYHKSEMEETMYYFKSKQMKSRRTKVHDKLEGLATGWHVNGQKESEKFYKDGKEEGTCIGWTNSGIKVLEYNYVNGLRDGIWQSWDKERKKFYECNYKKDEMDGLEIHWTYQGNKDFERNWKMGQLDGKSREWYDNKEKKSEYIYRDGEIYNFIEWDIDGNIRDSSQCEMCRKYIPIGENDSSSVWYICNSNLHIKIFVPESNILCTEVIMINGNVKVCEINPSTVSEWLTEFLTKNSEMDRHNWFHDNMKTMNKLTFYQYVAYEIDRHDHKIVEQLKYIYSKITDTLQEMKNIQKNITECKYTER